MSDNPRVRAAIEAADDVLYARAPGFGATPVVAPFDRATVQQAIAAAIRAYDAARELLREASALLCTCEPHVYGCAARGGYGACDCDLGRWRSRVAALPGKEGT